MNPAIEIRDVTVRYGDSLALERVSLQVRPGCVTGLVGMNGSGKSTLFKAIMGLVRPSDGEVRLHGVDPKRARMRAEVAYVPQHEEVDWHFPLCVRDVVMMGRYGHQGIMRRARATDHAAVRDALERVDLTDLAQRQIGRLSGGQKKRAFVARAIAQDAQILLLDEPFAGVDTRSEAMISALLRDLAREGRAILIATHNLHSLPELADEAVLLRRTVLFQGPVSEALRPERLAATFGLDVLAQRGEEA